MKILNYLTSVFTEQRATQLVRGEDMLWNSKSIKEQSVLLWDLENIPFYRLEDIKRVAKYTPSELYVITKQKLGEQLLTKITNQGFKVLNKHKDISDTKIISMMRLFKERENIMLVSSDSDFAKEVNRYTNSGKLQWVVVDNQKRGAIMRANLATSNLTISIIAHQASPNAKRVKHNKKVKWQSVQKNSFQPQNFSTLRVYIDYYRGRLLRYFKRVKKLYKKVRYYCCKNRKVARKIDVIAENPVQGKRYIFRRNYKGKRVRAGSIQFNTGGEKILKLYKKLSNTYDMPHFEKLIRFYKFKKVEGFIHFNTNEEEYYLNDFARTEVY
jgi:predicted nuclease of predicted toxin-antitoxin system